MVTGHGDADTGAMRLWCDTNGEGMDEEEYERTKGWLTTTKLMKHWRPSFNCDLIATQCGANAFVSEFMWPILLSYPNVRTMAACDVNRKCSYVDRFSDGSQAHVELMQFLMHYLRARGEGCDLKAAKKWTAHIESWKPPTTTTTQPVAVVVPRTVQQPSTVTQPTTVTNPQPPLSISNVTPTDAAENGQKKRYWIRYLLTFLIWLYGIPNIINVLSLLLYGIIFFVFYRVIFRGQ